MSTKYQEKLDEWKKRRAELLQRQNDGMSINDLARELNLSTAQINQLLKKARRDIGK